MGDAARGGNQGNGGTPTAPVLLRLGNQTFRLRFDQSALTFVDLEEATGWTANEFDERLKAGSVRAALALAWVATRWQHPNLSFRAFAAMVAQEDMERVSRAGMAALAAAFGKTPEEMAADGSGDDGADGEGEDDGEPEGNADAGTD